MVPALLEREACGAGGQPTGEQAARAFERLVQCALAALQQNPEGFAPLLPPWLQLVLDAALLAVDAATVRKGRAKRRLALVRPRPGKERVHQYIMSST